MEGCHSLQPVAKPGRHLVMQMQIFLYEESISEEMNNDDDLNLHSMTKLLGWLHYCLPSLPPGCTPITITRLMRVLNKYMQGVLGPYISCSRECQSFMSQDIFVLSGKM